MRKERKRGWIHPTVDPDLQMQLPETLRPWELTEAIVQQIYLSFSKVLLVHFSIRLPDDEA